MPTLLILYPAYGTISCARLASYAAQIEGLRLVLADEAVNITNEEIFEEVVELPPPEYLARAYPIIRRWCDKREALNRLENDDLRIELGTHVGARFYAPPNPETYRTRPGRWRPVPLPATLLTGLPGRR